MSLIRENNKDYWLLYGTEHACDKTANCWKQKKQEIAIEYNDPVNT